MGDSLIGWNSPSTVESQACCTGSTINALGQLTDDEQESDILGLMLTPATSPEVTFRGTDKST